MAYDEKTGIFSTPVYFHIARDETKIALLHDKAAQVDDENDGRHQAEYTLEQAFTVVWHAEPEWLVENRVLIGWTVEERGLFDKETIEWIDESTANPDEVAGREEQE